MSDFASIRTHPNYPKLPVTQQIEIAKTFGSAQLSNMAEYRMLNRATQKRILNDFALSGVTFENPETEASIKTMAQSYLNGEDDNSKKLRDFWSATVQNSGILGAVDRFILNRGDATAGRDRQRALEFYRELDEMAGKSDIAQEFGAIAGTLFDIVAVNLAMSPATGLAKTAIQTAAKGGAKGIAFAKATGAAAPIVNRSLHFFGPIAAEAAIEAIPYFAAEEMRRVQQGKDSVTAGGAVEIAKTLGQNAALDFVVGSMMTKVLMTGGRLGKALFRRGEKYREVLANEDTMNAILRNTFTGNTTPEFLTQLPEHNRALAQQLSGIWEVGKKGLTDPDAFAYGRDAWVANDLGKVLYDTVDAQNQRIFKVFEFAEDGKPTERIYRSLRDAEDYLSFRYFESQEELAQELVKKNPGMTFEDALFDESITRPNHAWALRRGAVLRSQAARFDATIIPDLDPIAKKALDNAPSWWKKTSSRPFITRGQADLLVSQNSDEMIAVPAQVELKGRLLEVVNSAAGKKSFNLGDGFAPISVQKSAEPNTLFIGNRRAPPEAYELANKYAAKALDDGYYKTPEEARAAFLLNRGYDHAVLPDQSYEFFTTRNMKLIGTVDDVVAPINKGVQSGNFSADSIISENRTGLLKPSAMQLNDDLILESAVKSLRSKDPEQIGTFAKLYTESLGYKPAGVKVTYVPGYGAAGATVDANDILEVKIPRAYRSFTDEKRQLDSLFRGLQSVSDKFPATNMRKAASSASYYVEQLSKKPFRFGFPSGVPGDSWAIGAIETMGGKVVRDKGNYFVSFQANRVDAVFKNAEDLVDWVAKKTLDDNAVVNDLLAQGTKLTKRKDGLYVARSLDKGALLAEGKTIEEILTKLEYVPTTLDLRYGARVVELTNEGISFELSGVKYLKDQKDAMKVLGKFADHEALSRQQFLKMNSKGSLTLQGNGKYHVHNLTLDFHKDFDSLSEARKFFEQGPLSTLDDLGEIANKKFLDLYLEKGQYVVKDLNGKITKVDNVDALHAVLKDYPDISESVPELIPLDPEVALALPDLAREFKVRTWQKGNPAFRKAPSVPEFSHINKPFRLNSYQLMQQMTSEAFGWFDAVAAKNNVPFLAETKKDLGNGMRQVRSSIQDAGRYLSQAFTDRKGRQLSRASRAKISYAVGSEESEDVAKALGTMYQARYKKALEALTPDEQKAAEYLKEYYRRMSDVFGIDYKKLIHVYMPRIREKLPIDLEAFADNPDALGFIKKHVPEWNNDVPHEIKVWFENERTAKIPEYFLKDDALEVALMYSTQGFKKKYLNPVFQRANRYIKEAKGALDERVGMRLAMLEDDIMGATPTRGERIVADVGQAFMRNLKKGPLGKLLPYDLAEAEEIGRNTLNNMLGLTYFSSMSFKPWLAIRNTFQTDTMLAMRVGIDWTYKAKDVVLKDIKKWTKLGFERGILNEKAPIVNLIYSQGKMGKFTDEAFRLFKNSDDYTRLVAYVAGDLRATNAINAYRMTPGMTKAKFLEMSGFDRFNPTYGEDAWKLLQEGTARLDRGTAGLVDVVTGKAVTAPLPESTVELDAIKDMYGNLLQRATMFDYSGASTPLLHRGVIGKLFGQFGTYSAGYRANIAEAMRYGTKGQKVASMATFLGITTAYWQAFEAMGIRTNDFIPGAPGIFGGGPLFNISTNLLQAASPDWEGQRARAELERDLSSLIPGSSQARYIKRGLEAIDAGDAKGLMASVLMIPLYSE